MSYSECNKQQSYSAFLLLVSCLLAWSSSTWMHSMSNAWCCKILNDPAEQVIMRRPSLNISSDLDIYSF